MQNSEKVQQACKYLGDKLGNFPENAIGVVLGTGLGQWASNLDKYRIPYEDIAGFPVSTVQSHAGAVLAGTVGDKNVIALSGRFHLYEGYDAGTAVTAIRTLAQLGVKTLIITNAAGALNPQFDAGDLMLITDHINFTGTTPLRGANVDSWGERFPDMTAVWNKDLQRLAIEQAEKSGVRLERGVYIQIPGPQMETPAETRMFKRLGADAIGMSTVIEAIAAHHMGVRLLGISCLTNKNLPDCMEEAPLEAVIAQANKSSGKLATLLNAVIESM